MGIRPSRAVARTSIAIVIFLATVSARVGAQGADDLGPVEITAPRIMEPSSVVPQSVTVIDAATIAAHGAATISQAIELAPGVEVTDKGPEGSELSATIRGSTSNQVLVLVDGVRINDPLTGVADLSRLPLDDVERIEVLPGGSSSLYGGDAVGGVIDIITKKGPRPFSLSFENGSYMPQSRIAGFGFSQTKVDPSLLDLVDSQKLSFAWGPRIGSSDFRVAGSAENAGNDYTYVDANDNERELQNAALLSGDLSLGASFPLPDARLSIDSAGFLSTKGDPGSEIDPSLTATETDGSARASVSYNAERFLIDALTLDATAHAEYGSVDYVDTAVQANDGHHKSLTIGGDLSQKAFVDDALTLVYGTSLSWIGASSNDLGSPTRLTTSAFVEPAMTFGKLSLKPSLRYDYYSDFSPSAPFGGIGAALGTVYALAEGQSLKADLTRTYRAPTFDDLYWPASDGAEGNPSLVPETAYEVDLGYERERDAWHFSGTLFARYAQDVILWEPGSGGIWRPSNYGVAFYPGLELSAAAELAGGLEISANYSYLRSFALDGGLTIADDKRLPFTPEHNLKGSLSETIGGTTWTISETYVSPRYLNTANVAMDPSYFVLDAIVRTRIGHAFSLYLAADNLLDESYMVVDGYPMPGTEIRTGFEFKP